MEIIKTVPANVSKTRLDKVCSEIFDDFSRSQLKKWILEGRILLNNEIALPKDLVNKNDEISLDPVSEDKIAWEAEDISFEVIFENKDYLIINKPFNLVMHPGAGCNHGTLANGLLFYYPELKTIPRAGIVHRLDKDTSGILLVARTERFRNYFVQLLQERKVKKLYKAVVVGKTIGSFEISEPIGRDKNNRTKMSIRSNGKDALTFVKLNESLNNYSLLDVRIETGRTHQIRVHLSNKKLPIIGDKTYNPSNNVAKETPKELIETIRTFPRQALHSYQLSFMDMDTDEMMSFSATLSDDIKKLIETLKKHT